MSDPIPDYRKVGPEGDLPVELAGIDMLLGLQLLGDRRSLYLALLHKFLAGHRGTAQDIRRALAAADWATAERLAHNTKGVSSYLGATDLQGHAGRLEKAINLQSDDLAARLLEFETALNEVMTELAAKLPRQQDL